MANDDICAGCHKKGKKSLTGSWICVNKHCDFGRNHKGVEYKNPKMKWGFEHYLFQAGFWGGIIAMLVSQQYNHFDHGVISFVAGAGVWVLTNIISWAMTDGYYNPKWYDRRKMYWFISKPFGVYEPE